jgi:hypothetical protein
MNSNDTTTTKAIDPDFLPIDGPDTGLPSFILAMLRTAQIETAKEYERREITSETISRWMKKHRNHIPTTYRPKEIREQLWRYGGEIRGGGVKIEWSELPETHYGSARHYHFTFTKLLKPEQMVGELA